MIAWYQVSSRLAQTVFECSSIKISYVSTTWFQDLINFMSEYKITIVVKTPHINMSKQRNIKHIMEEIIQLNLLQFQTKK